MTDKINYPRLYQLTNEVTPLKGDCGELCHSVCCKADDKEELGMYLLPGEETMFTGQEDWLQWEKRHPEEDDFPSSWSYPVNFIFCTKPCPREKRPLSCRFFPLAPHLLKDGTLLLIHETMDLPYSCPLIANRMPLEPKFVQVVASCWLELIQDQRIRDLVVMDSAEREKDGCEPHVVWMST